MFRPRVIPRFPLMVVALFMFLFFLSSSNVFAYQDSSAMHSKTVQSQIDSVEHAGATQLDKEKVTLSTEEEEVELGRTLPIWSAIPFIGILLSIALFPLFAGHFWEKHFPKISAMWALLFAIPFVWAYGHDAVHEILHIYLFDYIPFIILLWGLFTVAGGILIKGTLKGTPAVNVLLLLIGTILSSWIGTTGSAMVMIRPLIRANESRKYKVQTMVFFIFLVANVGGSLTPLGDPPLFLGFLHGVSFFWTFHLLPETSFTAGFLLLIYFILDSFYYRKEGPLPDGDEKHPIRIEGAFNLIFLVGIIIGVLFSGVVHLGEFTVYGLHIAYQNEIRDIWIVAMGLLSLHFTSKEIRKGNDFNWFPILEVAYLFAGIFMTIIPALAILKAGEHGALASLVKAVKDPVHYFWVTGGLSSFLDNAPTYLTFFNSALGTLGLSEEHVRAAFAAGDVAKEIPEFIRLLVPISIGAVFMGANTYIGNAPNFMVKSICEESDIKMPSFFGYIFKWSLPILIPTFIIVMILFIE